MTSHEWNYLLALAATIGLAHTLMGPDHYLPFIAMSRVGRWSFRRTMAVTVLCGLAHVLSSVALGALGILLGVAVLGLERIESLRGDLAGWLLLGFGLAYLVWGVHRAVRNRPHGHSHIETDQHQEDAPGRMTPWVLFTIFVFGPCEPLIPQLMYPAARGSAWGVAAVVLVFGVVTIATMLAAVTVGCLGLNRLRLPNFERYSHATAGFALTACGAAMKFGL